jgi:transcriptional regulator with XRE-family HTH domain
MKEIVERIKLLQDESGLDKKSFAERINISAASLSHVHTGRNNPSLELILNIIKSHPNLSAEWLLFGLGPKYKERYLRYDQSSVNEENTALTKDNENVKREVKNKLNVLKMLIEEHYKSEVNFVKDLEEKHFSFNDKT